MKCVFTLPITFLLLSMAPLSSHANIISFSNTDFTNTAVFSTVTTYDFSINVAAALQPGPVNDPGINDILGLSILLLKRHSSRP